MKGFKITLQEKGFRFLCQEKPDYHVMLNGERVSDLYFNMTGYCGSIPKPKGGSVSIGECSLSEWKKFIAKMNKGEVE